jgi:hypothetical protein
MARPTKNVDAAKRGSALSRQEGLSLTGQVSKGGSYR